MTFPDLDSLQQEIHTLVELDADTPESTDGDYTIRTTLANKWIRHWEGEDGMLWNELWKTGSFTSTGATSYLLSSQSITDLRRPGGYVYDDLNNLWSVLRKEDIALMKNSDSYYCYFTGDEHVGFTLYFGDYYPATGRTIYIPYFKKATTLTTGSTKPEMSDPYYIVYGVASDLKSSEDPGESDKFFQLAQKSLRDMKIRNLQVPPYMNNQIADRHAMIGKGGFGV